MKLSKIRICFFSIFIIVFSISYASDDIIVEARKKKEKLEDVPQSVRQFNEQTIEEAGIDNLRDMADLAPNVSIIGSSSARYITPYIRGVGNQDLNLPEDISVGFYLDEVPLPRYAFDNELIDIKSVEVMRGPQGTLFGRNTQAGAINILTKDPAKENQHSISAEYGNLDKKLLSATTNFVLTDSLRNRLSIQYKSRDGYIDDTLLNRDLSDFESLGFNDTLVFEPSDTAKLTFKLGVQKNEGTDPFFLNRDTDGYPKSAQDISPDYEMNLVTNSVKGEFDLGQYDLTTILAFNYYDFGVKYDEADYYVGNDYLVDNFGATLAAQYINNPDFFWRDIQEYQRQYYSEVRLSNKNDDFSWSAGLNYTKSNYRIRARVNTTGGSPFRDVHQNVRLITDSFSIFGEGVKKLGRKFSLTVGSRLIHDRKKFDSYHTSTGLSLYKQESQENFTNYVLRTSLGHKTTKNVNTYMSVARGYQSGGFPSFQFNNYNGLSENQPAYDESSSLSYELGAKSHFLNKRLRINVALFFNDIKDKQERVKDGATDQSYYANIDTDSFGAELESIYEINSNWQTGLNIGHTNTKFKEQAVSNNRVTINDGARARNVPYFSGSSHIQFARYISSLNSMLLLRSTYKYTGSRYGDNTNQTLMGSYGLWSFKATLDWSSYTLSAYMNNAFNKQYETQAYYHNGLATFVSTPGLPRLYGLRGTYRF